MLSGPFHQPTVKKQKAHRLTSSDLPYSLLHKDCGNHELRMHTCEDTGFVATWKQGAESAHRKQVYHYDMETESGQLMLSELKSRPRSEPTYPAAVDWSAYARSVRPFLSEQSNFPGMIYFDEFTFPELKRNTGSDTVCQQICTLLKSQTTDLRTCGESVGSAFTKFEEFSLGGTFAMRCFLTGHSPSSQLAPERPSEDCTGKEREKEKMLHVCLEEISQTG
ncbi:hypothetical protein PANDA_012156 [Ailuropoda melanoleuca]|uniref:Vanin C-terminal domain-containing protein n=1 Tax=Ailuropoda melanoleuca TaxID=9646 RepID=D2HL34_AILME|nr:hypothetical protein PANDA_012156 [Ailuropoda melanoleuca]